MTRVIVKFLSLLIVAGLVSCRAARIPARNTVGNGTAASYIENYKDLAISEMRRTGVPASITLAQGMLESDYGRSSLARVANNHFGIKCHNDWAGQTVRQHDDRRNECFRKYQRPEDSFYDHSDFLRSGSRYSPLFKLDPEDYRAWAHGLKRAGYATNPDYASLVIRKIEENNLDLLDKGVYTARNPKQPEKFPAKNTQGSTVTDTGKATAANSVPVRNSSVNPGQASDRQTPQNEETITFGEVLALAPRILENNRVQYIIVKDGETREKIEAEFQLLKRDLANYNDLPPDFVPVSGQVLYIAPKREKAEAGKEFHTASDNETMHSISQKYGIRLKSLLEMNRMSDSIKPVPGQKIWLQGIKPAN